ncbi:hypothetical protein DEJ45_32345 [Streptomyces venezuelae]|nr:hypothetical protein DEJ45_32345 [Streptomyces venezuelae]
MLSDERIADPRGRRTPYGRGGRWPERTDSCLAEGVAEEAANEVIPTAWDPVSKQPRFKTAAAALTLVAPAPRKPQEGGRDTARPTG